MTEAEAVTSGAGEWPAVNAISRNGGIRMRITEQGIPLAVKIDPAELHRDPAHLAAEMLRICRRAADEAGLATRKKLEAAGMSPAALAATGLPTEADLARQEIVEEQDYDTEPQSWLRTV
ncbi:hypothetical protein [Nocardia sp. NPDC005978]|uniref:hypothetical protein n=1 Tax=unclassified Nocardia TaxID=2637762 RepID=UPI0033A96D50